LFLWSGAIFLRAARSGKRSSIGHRRYRNPVVGQEAWAMGQVSPGTKLQHFAANQADGALCR
jgi:hypothetical protein